MLEIKLSRNISIAIWPEKQYLESRFRTGSVLPAAPNWQHEPSVRLAHEIGYAGDCWRLSRDHEILHHVTAMHAGAPWSWTLFWEAHKATHNLPKPPIGLYSHEEGVTIALQAYLSLGTKAPALEQVSDLDALVQRARSVLEPLEDLRAA